MKRNPCGHCLLSPPAQIQEKAASAKASLRASRGEASDAIAGADTLLPASATAAAKTGARQAELHGTSGNKLSGPNETIAKATGKGARPKRRRNATNPLYEGTIRGPKHEYRSRFLLEAQRKALQVIAVVPPRFEIAAGPTLHPSRA